MCAHAGTYICFCAVHVDSEGQCVFVCASFIHATVTCRSHLEITSLMAIDPLQLRELDNINVVLTQTF